MLDKKEDGEQKPSIQPTIKKLIGGLAFAIIMPLFISSMMDLNLINECKYYYTYNDVDLDQYKDQFRSFLGIHITPHDPNPLCVKYTETPTSSGNPNFTMIIYKEGGSSGEYPKICRGVVTDTSSVIFDKCGRHLNPADKITEPVFVAIKGFELVIATLIFIGAGIPFIKYQLGPKGTCIQ